MNQIIKKLEIPGYETKMVILPRKDTSAKAENVPVGFQLSLDIEIEPKKQDQ